MLQAILLGVEWGGVTRLPPPPPLLTLENKCYPQFYLQNLQFNR